MNYLVPFAGQLSQHLRALRKARGMSQTALAAQLGVNQSRIAAIEKNPAAISVDQLFRLLNALGVQLVLQDAPAASATTGEPPQGEW